MAHEFTKRRFRNIERALLDRDRALSPAERKHLNEELHAANPFRWETWSRIVDGLAAIGYPKMRDASNGCGIMMCTAPGDVDPTRVLERIGLMRDGGAWVGGRFDIRVERAKNDGMKAIMLTHPNDGIWVDKAKRYYDSL